MPPQPETPLNPRRKPVSTASGMNMMSALSEKEPVALVNLLHLRTENICVETIILLQLVETLHTRYVRLFF